MRLRTVVVDDEDLARRRVSELVRASPLLELVGEAAHGAEALDVIAALQPDLVFLDIQMPEADGFEVLAALEEEVPPAVVFVTAYDAYAIQAFDVGAFDYLLKPVSRQRFEEAVARVASRSPARGPAAEARALAVRMERRRGFLERFAARRGDRHYFVRAADVDWIEADGNYLRLHTGGRSHLVRQTMKDAEARLDPARFTRIHRSTIVAIDRISTLRAREHGDWEVTMVDGVALTSSRPYAPQVRALLR